MSVNFLLPAGTKRCPTCDTVKPIEAFALDRSKNDGRKYRCKECDARYAREKYQASAEHRAQKADYYRRTVDARRAYNLSDAVKGKNHARKQAAKERALRVYGGCCVRCGSTEYLQFDHVNNDGAEHRLAERWWNMIFRIAKLGEPIDDFELQLLCDECHRLKTMDAWKPRPLVCPHCKEPL